jgi:hypothetical protein
MPESIKHDYEVSSEGAVRHWEIPYDRLEDTTPTETFPAAVLSVTDGTQLTGTVLTLDADEEVAVIDFTCSMVYYQYVRNVLTYDAGAEDTWGAINIGDPVYYDRSGTMPAAVKLSTSPLDSAGDANPLFGFVVPKSDADMVLYPLGGVTASTQECAIMQVGAGN